MKRPVVVTTVMVGVIVVCTGFVAVDPSQEEVSPWTLSPETANHFVADAQPNLGRRTFQRLNSAEYERSVHDLLGIGVDVATFSPPISIGSSVMHCELQSAISQRTQPNRIRNETENRSTTARIETGARGRSSTYV